MHRNDLLLLTVAGSEEGGLTPVQLQKALFLIGQSKLQGLPADYYEFIPYNYGPFDSDIYVDADRLSAEGHLAQIPVHGRAWSIYQTTSAGRERTRQIQSECDPALATYVKAAVQWVRSLSFSPNPPKDTDGRREESGRGVRELQGK